MAASLTVSDLKCWSLRILIPILVVVGSITSNAQSSTEDVAIEECVLRVTAIEVNLPDTVIAAIRNENCSSRISSVKLRFTNIYAMGTLTLTRWVDSNAVVMTPPAEGHTSDWIKKKFESTGAGPFRMRLRISQCNGVNCESINVKLKPAYKDSITYNISHR